MNEQRIKGKVEELKGDVKQRVGGATKNRSLEGEGFLEEAKGKIRQGVENLKEKLRGDKPLEKERGAKRGDEKVEP